MRWFTSKKARVAKEQANMKAISNRLKKEKNERENYMGDRWERQREEKEKRKGL